MNYRATVVTTTEDLAEWNGRKVSIVRVIKSPEEGVDADALPLFRVVDDRGNKTTLFPEELRTEHSDDCNEEADDPVISAGGVPVTDLHPVVRQTLLSMH